MKSIDADWLKARLTGARGERARLADALGIGADKVTKILKGERAVQPQEVPKLLAFFGIVMVEDGDGVARQKMLSKLSRLNEAGQALVERHLDDILATPALVRDGRSTE